MIKTNKLFLNSLFIYILSLLTSGLISFISIPLIIKLYGLELYGSFSLIQNIILIFISFGCGWLNQCILRFNNNSSNFKITIFQLYLILIVPLSLLSFATLYFVNSNVFVIILATITIFFGGISALSVTFYQSKFIAKKSFYFEFIRVVVFFLLIVVFYYLFSKFDNLIRLTFSFFLSYFISFLFLLKIDFKFFVISVKMFFSKINKSYFLLFFKENKYLFHYGLPLALWFTMSSLLNVSDRYIISHYLNKEDLGIYSAVYDLLFKGITLLYAPILVAGYPILTDKYNQNKKKVAYQFLKKLVLLEICIFVVVIIIAYFLKSYFIETIVGIPISEKSLGIVMPIIVGAFIWQLAMLVHKPLEFELKTKVMLVLIVITLIVNVSLNLLFIKTYGIMFAAYSTLFSAFLYLILVILKLSFK